MLDTLIKGTRRAVTWTVVQTVPPALLGAFVAYEISRATALTFGQATGLVALVLVVCAGVGTLQKRK